VFKFNLFYAANAYKILSISVALGSAQPLNRNEYQEYFLEGGGLTNLPPSCAKCLEIWEAQPAGTFRACPGTDLPLPFTSQNCNHLIVNVVESVKCLIYKNCK